MLECPSAASHNSDIRICTTTNQFGLFCGIRTEQSLRARCSLSYIFLSRFFVSKLKNKFSHDVVGMRGVFSLFHYLKNRCAKITFMIDSNKVLFVSNHLATCPAKDYVFYWALHYVRCCHVLP